MKKIKFKIITLILLILPLWLFRNFFIIRNDVLKINFVKFLIFYILFYLIIKKILKYLSYLKNNRNIFKLDMIFVFIFFISLMIPISNISNEIISKNENRNLSKYQPLITNEHKINYNFGKDFENYFNDRFFGRDLLLSYNKKIESLFNSKYGNGLVVVGKNNWLFFNGDNAIENYQNINLFSGKELKQISNYLQTVNEWCEKNGKFFYFFIIPDKDKIYGEYHQIIKKINPDSFSRANQLIKYLKKHTNVKVIYPYNLFYAHKKDGLLYYKHDSHWNELGAYWGYKALIDEVKKDVNVGEVLLTERSLYKKDKGTQDLDRYYLDNNIQDFSNYIRFNIIKNDFQKFTNYNLMVFGDSFYYMLDLYMKKTFNSIGFKKYISPSLNDHLLNTDVIILESVERLLVNLKNAKFY